MVIQQLFSTCGLRPFHGGCLRLSGNIDTYIASYNSGKITVRKWQQESFYAWGQHNIKGSSSRKVRNTAL